MSLLLDALKKAELAKQIARAESSSPEQLGSEPEAPTPRVITREKLPDITQPLEILTDDLPSSEQKPAAAAVPRQELSLEDDPLPYAPTAQSAPPMGAPDPTGGRAQAEQLFQVKEMDSTPRRPFYLTLGALGVVAVGYAGYVWWQTRPASNYSPSAAVPSAAAPVAAVAPTPAPVPASASPA